MTTGPHAGLGRAAPLVSLLVALAASAQAPAASAAEPSCAAVLTIQAESHDSTKLRAALAAGALGQDSAPACRDAIVRLHAVEAGWLLSVDLGEDHVEREVASIADAATWLESWLLPSLVEPSEEAETDASDATVPAPQDQPADESVPELTRSERSDTELATPEDHSDASHPVPTWPAGSIGLAATTALADDRSAWGGGELAGQLYVGGSLWVGAAVGARLDPVFDDDSAAGDDIRRRIICATLRTGLSWGLGPGVAVDAGLGVGLASAVAQHSDDGVTTTDDEGAALAELFAVAVLDVGYSWALTAGLGVEAVAGLEGDDPDDRDSTTADGSRMPAAHPTFFGTARVGLAHRFGGGI